MLKKVTFNDEGQDFLEWDIDKGMVVACRPFQERVWKGTKVHTRKIRPGGYLDITLTDGRRTILKHPVESIVVRIPEVPAP